MKHVSMADAEARLDELVSEAEAGETIEILRDGRVVARLVPAEARPRIDIEALRRHQQRLTSPIQDTETELAEWKNESRY